VSSATHHHEAQEHSHSHGDHGHEHPSGARGFLTGLLNPHSHDHGNLAADRAFADNQAGIRTVWIALAALTVTSLLQLSIVFASGSVALLADTAHNIGDGLNSIPLLIAFYLARKAATRRYTYGYGRAEDIAGIFIVLSILVSAGVVFWESFQRLLNPQPLEVIGWVAAAAVIGFLGNEAVAIFQIRAGKRIGSEALIADGLHARTDGLTSLAVLLAAGGSKLGFALADPIIGLLIGVAILFITWDATKRIWYRLMDTVEPEIIDQVEMAVTTYPWVQSIKRLRLRWVGHQLQGDMVLSIVPTANYCLVQQELRYAVHQVAPKLTDLEIELVEEDDCEQTAPASFVRKHSRH
jgi:cation diffusion facilitator family transporter